MRVRLGLLALALMLLLPAAESAAEPDRSATLNAANPTFSWESSGSGVPDPTGFLMEPALRCSGTPPFRCDYILLDIETAGELTLTLNSAKGVIRDLDGYLYKSTAAGEPLGRTLTTDCATFQTSETCKVAVQPGYYVLEVEYFTAVMASYIGTADLVPAPPAPPPVEPETITAEDCNFTLYYFRDSAERLRERVPPGYRLRPYPGSQLVAEGSATIAAAAYDCDRMEIPGSPPGPGIFTLLSVLVYPPEETFEGPASSDFYVLWVHADNPHLVDLLASRGMPAHHVPGMRFEKPALSLAVRVEVPWSSGPFELGTTGYHQDVFHSHDNTFLHVAADGRPVRMDFFTRRARDHFCFQVSDHHNVPCGNLKAQTGSPVATFFGASDRAAHNVWDHDPLERSFFLLH